MKVVKLPAKTAQFCELKLGTVFMTEGCQNPSALWIRAMSSNGATMACDLQSGICVDMDHEELVIPYHFVTITVR